VVVIKEYMFVEDPTFAKIDVLCLSEQTENKLKQNGIFTIQDLCQRSPQQLIKVVGSRGLHEIQANLRMWLQDTPCWLPQTHPQFGLDEEEM
jgi:DNA-directed RNA polymerase alpha subunit